MDAVKLERLLVEEISGVDDPANMLPGWQIMKAAASSGALQIEAYTVDGKGFHVVDKAALRTLYGDDEAAWEEHFTDIFRSLGLSPEKLAEGSGVITTKTAGAEAETPSSSSPPLAPASHHSQEQPGEDGQWFASLWKDATRYCYRRIW